MRTRNPPKLIMIVSLIMQLIMSCLVFQCTSIRCVRGPYYEYHGRGYAVLPGVDIRCHACFSVS